MTRRTISAFLSLVAVTAAACGGARSTVVGTPPAATIASPVPPSPTPSLEARPAVALVAVPHVRYLAMWKRPGPGTASFAFDARSPNGGRAPMLVEARRTVDGEPWVQIELPVRPNGKTAWAKASDVALEPRHQEIVVDLSERVLRRYVDGRLVDRFRVGIGQPQDPTAVGTFYVWVKVPFPDPSGPYGVYALGLSGFSPVLSDWPGGGRMAIHGTVDASDRGRAVSHGCVRVYNPDMRRLRNVPLGTPVVIRR